MERHVHKTKDENRLIFEHLAGSRTPLIDQRRPGWRLYRKVKLRIVCPIEVRANPEKKFWHKKWKLSGY
jgi:hypothetical protein